MDRFLELLAIWYPRHRIAYVAIIGGLTLLNVYQGAPWWAVWPMMIWGVVLMVHMFIVKSCEADDEWVDDRALGLRYKSYDFGHIKDLERRIGERDVSVEPHSDDEDLHKKK